MIAAVKRMNVGSSVDVIYALSPPPPPSHTHVIQKVSGRVGERKKLERGKVIHSEEHRSYRRIPICRSVHYIEISY